MKKQIMAIALASLAFASQAQEGAQPVNAVAPFLGIGLTYGGDQIGDDIQYKNGDSSTLHGGALIDLRAGLEYTVPESPLSFQLSMAYHADSVSAENGDADFTRFPLEALVHYRVNPSWRVGGGLRKALNAKSSSSGAGSGYVADQKFKASVGLVLEAETHFTRNLGLKIRVVSEKYKPDGNNGYNSNESLDGSHIGVIGVYYFK